MSPLSASRMRLMRDTLFARYIQLYLDDRAFNRFGGSVALEKLQNLMRSRHPDLYADVVGFGQNAWRNYLRQHQMLFAVFAKDENQLRVHLTSNLGWEFADACEARVRNATESHLVACITEFLAQKCTSSPTSPSGLPGVPGVPVDEFIAAYPSLPLVACNPEAFPLPPRGDLVRFIRKHPGHFYYDDAKWMICLAQNGCR
eukprot:NODE_3547_length_957_cov_3.842511_g3257_i0.p1 GENE.NODE_3547_length_957_cov_3.842511_g3257_i0~~NODE_3547_length_957_cov_3.842511_g3257_i0.p1  ORF type:complete len:218 (+),score=19.74 NODE_3547_length_957_cov_3.842511_g3257_i0:54-656(+)